MYASGEGYKKVVKLLIQAGADLNLQDEVIHYLILIIIITDTLY